MGGRHPEQMGGRHPEQKRKAGRLEGQVRLSTQARKMRLSSVQFQRVYFHSEYIFDTPPRCDEGRRRRRNSLGHQNGLEYSTPTRPRRRAADKRDEIAPPHGAYPKAKSKD